MGQTITYFIIFVTEALIAWQYLDAIFYPKYKKTISFFASLIGYLLLFFVSFKEIYWLNTISFFVINIIYGCAFFKAGVKKSIFHSLVLTVAMNVTELIMMNALALIFKDFSAYAKELYIFILLAVTSKVLYYFVLQIIIRLLGNKKDCANESGIITVLLCTIPIVSMWITVTLIFIGIEGHIPEHLNWVVSIGSVLMLILNMCVFFIYNLTQQDNEKYLQAQLQLQKESDDAKYYKMLLVQDENQKILIHDIKKHLHTVYDLLEDDQVSDVKSYINRIIQSKELNEKMCFCDNSTLNLILVRYKEVCRENNIEFWADIRKDTVSRINIEDIVSLFGNLLENAVEAATGVENSYIDLSVKKGETTQVMISMVNSCSTVPIQTLSGDYVSKKRDNQKHGIGMKSIRKIVKKYKGMINSYYNEEDQTFHTMITI